MKILAVDDEKLALDSMADAIREASPEAELFTFQKPKEQVHGVALLRSRS